MTVVVSTVMSRILSAIYMAHFISAASFIAGFSISSLL